MEDQLFSYPYVQWGYKFKGGEGWTRTDFSVGCLVNIAFSLDEFAEDLYLRRPDAGPNGSGVSAYLCEDTLLLVIYKTGNRVYFLLPTGQIHRENLIYNRNMNAVVYRVVSRPPLWGVGTNRGG
jgi:hypothetical protein